MRKLLLAIVAGLLLLPTTSAQAAAPSLAERGILLGTDPDDSADVLDIYQVGTEAGARRTFFGVSGYEFFGPRAINARKDSYFVYLLDVTGGPRFDYRLGLYYWPPDDQFYCELQTRGGQVVGRKVAGFDPGVIFCYVPNHWYPAVKTPGYFVEAWHFGHFVDRAPDSGRYFGFG